MRRDSKIRLSGEMKRRFAIVRVDRGLAELEQAGLITVDRQRGRRPTITIVEVAEPAAS